MGSKKEKITVVEAPRYPFGTPIEKLVSPPLGHTLTPETEEHVNYLAVICSIHGNIFNIQVHSATPVDAIVEKAIKIHKKTECRAAIWTQPYSLYTKEEMSVGILRPHIPPKATIFPPKKRYRNHNHSS